MPKKDPTFSDRDLVRLFVRALTHEEQENVRAWFLVSEIRKKNELKGTTLLLKLASFFLRSVPGFSLLMDIFLEGQDIFGELMSEKQALQRLRDANIPE